MQLVLDSNEYLFAFGVERKSSCEALFQTLLEAPEASSSTSKKKSGAAREDAVYSK